MFFFIRKTRITTFFNKKKKGGIILSNQKKQKKQDKIRVFGCFSFFFFFSFLGRSMIMMMMMWIFFSFADTKTKTTTKNWEWATKKTSKLRGWVEYEQKVVVKKIVATKKKRKEWIKLAQVVFDDDRWWWWILVFFSLLKINEWKNSQHWIISSLAVFSLSRTVFVLFFWVVKNNKQQQPRVKMCSVVFFTFEEKKRFLVWLVWLLGLFIFVVNRDVYWEGREEKKGRRIWTIRKKRQTFKEKVYEKKLWY